MTFHNLPWMRKTAQIILALCCFALPIFFIPLALRESGSNLWMRAGLSKNVVRKILLPIGTSTLQYALVANKGVYRSADNGMTWLAVNNGLPLGKLSNIIVQALAVDGSNPSIVYAGMGGSGSRNAALSAGLYLTNDGGSTWLGLGRVMAGKEVQAIAVMSASATSTSIICAATDGEIHCSADRGHSWQRLDWRGVETRILALALWPGNANALYVGTEGYGLYGTRDGGNSWVEMNQGLDDLNIYDIAISTVDPRIMYLATNGGVYRSTDAGASWVKLNGAAKGRRVNTIALHPEDEDILFIGLQHGAAYYSVDGGQQWVPIRRGLGNLTVLSLAVDPRNPSVLWAGTVDGIWRCTFGAPASPTLAHAATTLSITPETTRSVMPKPSATPTPTGTHIFTITPTLTVTPTPSSTITSTPRPSPTYTFTPSPTPTATAVPPSPLPFVPPPTLVPR